MKHLRDRENVLPIRYGCSGSIASVWPSTGYFRSTPANGHRQTGPGGPVRANSRHEGSTARELLARFFLDLLKYFDGRDHDMSPSNPPATSAHISSENSSIKARPSGSKSFSAFRIKICRPKSTSHYDATAFNYPHFRPCRVQDRSRYLLILKVLAK